MNRKKFSYAARFGLGLVLLMFCLMGEVSNADIFLSGNEIDLLVGTPTGISEPLDNRRTRHNPLENADFSSFLEDDTDYQVEFAEMDWSDSEDQQMSEDQAESTLLDLLSETGELESDEFSTDNELNCTDKIETEFNL